MPVPVDDETKRVLVGADGRVLCCCEREVTEINTIRLQADYTVSDHSEWSTGLFCALDRSNSLDVTYNRIPHDQDFTGGSTYEFKLWFQYDETGNCILVFNVYPGLSNEVTPVSFSGAVDCNDAGGCGRTAPPGDVDSSFAQEPQASYDFVIGIVPLEITLVYRSGGGIKCNFFISIGCTPIINTGCGKTNGAEDSSAGIPYTITDVSGIIGTYFVSNTDSGTDWSVTTNVTLTIG